MTGQTFLLLHSQQTNYIFLSQPAERVGLGARPPRGVRGNPWHVLPWHPVPTTIRGGVLNETLAKASRSSGRGKPQVLFLCSSFNEERCPVLIKTAAVAAFTLLQQPQFTSSQQFPVFVAATLPVAPASFSLKDADWSRHTPFDWQQSGWDVFRIDQREFQTWNLGDGWNHLAPSYAL